ncbi:hypothetical protein D3C72_1276130 [compost metagenome]
MQDAEAEAVLGVEDESGFEVGEGEHLKEGQGVEGPELAAGLAQGRDEGHVLGIFGGPGGQDDGHDQGRDECKCSRREERHVMAPVAGHASQRGANHHAETEAGPQDPEGLGAGLGRGNVSGVGHGRRKGRGAEGSAQDAGGEKLPEGLSEAEPEEREREADDTDQQHGLTADPVGDPTPEGGADHVHDRVRGEQEAHRARVSAEIEGLERKGRDDDPEAGHDQEKGEEEDRQEALGLRGFDRGGHRESP